MHAPLASAEAAQRHRAGLFYGLGAYLLWGVLPLYFKALAHVSATEIVAHRILWSLLFLAALLTFAGRWRGISVALRTPRVVLTLAATAILIATNWLIWVWAVNNGHVLEGSLGYYLNPLVNVLMGTLLLKEKLSRPQIGAVLLAAAGVAVLAWGASSGLWISLSLAASFATYGLLRKVVDVEALEGLSIETAMLTPIALGWILWMNYGYGGGGGGLGFDAGTTILLVAAGAVTAVPLLLFTAAARRLPYSLLGFLQYIAPSMQFLFAVLVFGERLTTSHIICFGAIWAALAIFSFDTWRRSAAARREAALGLA
jgi:chloramphenicol-sensitive protein RarD